VAYHAELAERVRKRVSVLDGITELKMFGGWGITIHGNMAIGVMNNDLIVRVGPDNYDAALTRPGARTFDFTGRTMTGWVYVSGSTLADGRTLNRWVDLGTSYAQSLPRKAAQKRSATPKPRR
jgi:TfoX/Sxy family transcriptional regulator of competence genes